MTSKKTLNKITMGRTVRLKFKFQVHIRIIVDCMTSSCIHTKKQTHTTISSFSLLKFGMNIGSINKNKPAQIKEECQGRKAKKKLL